MYLGLGHSEVLERPNAPFLEPFIIFFRRVNSARAQYITAGVQIEWKKPRRALRGGLRARDFFVDNLLVRIHLTIEML